MNRVEDLGARTYRAYAIRLGEKIADDFWNDFVVHAAENRGPAFRMPDSLRRMVATHAVLQANLNGPWCGLHDEDERVRYAAITKDAALVRLETRLTTEPWT